MIFEIIFNIIAVVMFITMFFKMIKKNNTQYLYILLMQFIGILINFIELIFIEGTNVTLKLIAFILSIMLPVVVFGLEKRKKIDFPEMLNIFLANLMLKMRKETEAKRYLLTLINKYPESFEGHKLLAEVYEKEGRISNAVSEYLRAIEISPKEIEINYNIANLMHAEGKNNEAIELLQDVLKKKPEHFKCTELLGDILIEQERYKEAISAYTNSLRYNPVNYNLYYNLGIAYTMLNDFQRAKEYYEKAAELNSLLYHAKLSLAQIAIIYGELDEAEMYLFESLKDKELESGSYYYLAQIAMLKGDEDKAINYMKVAVEIEPELYEKMEKDTIFIPIKNNIEKPAEYRKKQQRKLTMDQKVQKHLENTCSIVGKLNNSDLKMMRNVLENQKYKGRER